MRNTAASLVDAAPGVLNFSQFPVRGVPEAMEFLRGERFVFVGAPNRWRKEMNGRVLRADIRPVRDGGCVVLLFQWQTRPDGSVSDGQSR